MLKVTMNKKHCLYIAGILPVSFIIVAFASTFLLSSIVQAEEKCPFTAYVLRREGTVKGAQNPLLPVGTTLETGRHGALVLSIKGIKDGNCHTGSTIIRVEELSSITIGSAKKTGWHIMLNHGSVEIFNPFPDRFIRVNTPDIETRVQGRFGGEYLLSYEDQLSKLTVNRGRIHIICMKDILGPVSGGTFEPGDTVVATGKGILYDHNDCSFANTSGADSLGMFSPDLNKRSSAVYRQHLRPKSPHSPLRNKSIAIDSGHGGFTGTVNPVISYAESEVNLRVVMMLRHMLKACGARVILTKDDNRRRLSLKNRVKIANGSNVEAFVSVHHNASNKKGWKNRTEVYHRREEDEGSVRLANIICNHLDNTMKLKDLGGDDAVVLPAGYYVIKHTDMPAALGEASYLQDPEEARRLHDFDRVFREAYSYFTAIRDYFGGDSDFRPRSMEMEKVHE